MITSLMCYKSPLALLPIHGVPPLGLLPVPGVPPLGLLLIPEVPPLGLLPIPGGWTSERKWEE